MDRSSLPIHCLFYYPKPTHYSGYLCLIFITVGICNILTLRSFFELYNNTLIVLLITNDDTGLTVHSSKHGM